MSEKPFYTWAEVLESGLVHDASGIENPAKCRWQKADNIFYPIRTIDCTPTWAGVLGWYLTVLSEGNLEGQKIARKELANMAKVADAHVDQLKLEILLQIDNDKDNVVTLGELVRQTSTENPDIIEPYDEYTVGMIANLKVGQEFTWGVKGAPLGETIIKRIQ